MDRIYAVKTKYVTKETWKDEPDEDGKTRRACVKKQVLKTNYFGAHGKTIKKMIRTGLISKMRKPYVKDGWAIQEYY